MPDITLAQLNAMKPADADTWLRQRCTEVLEPGPWDHDWPDRVLICACRRCSQSNAVALKSCPVPHEAYGSWADLAERLCSGRDIERLTANVQLYLHDWSWERTFRWWLKATAHERVICLLIALGMVKI